MFKKSLTILFFLLLLTGCVSPQAQTENSAAINAYSEFIGGALNLETDGTPISINDLLYYYSHSVIVDGEAICDRYALFDMNNDNVPELLIASDRTYILTYKSGKLYLWWTDEYWSGYSRVLSNGHILHIRPGAAPAHLTYHYLILNNAGEEMQHIVFEQYDMDEDGTYDYFEFEEDKDLSRDEWLQRTRQYLSAEEIAWKEYSYAEAFIKDLSSKAP